jgi:hypothetical protein
MQKYFVASLCILHGMLTLIVCCICKYFSCHIQLIIVRRKKKCQPVVISILTYLLNLLTYISVEQKNMLIINHKLSLDTLSNKTLHFMLKTLLYLAFPENRGFERELF